MSGLPFVDLPIVLAPMAGAATAQLVVAVSQARGFGILPCAYATPDQIASDVATIRAATTRPFGINLFVEQTPYAADAALLARAHERLRVYRDRLHIAQPQKPSLPPERYAAQIDAVLAARPALFSFTFGIPEATVLARFRAARIPTFGTATTVDEARALAAAGVDGIIAQGSEAGGHRGTFLTAVADTLVGTLALVPQIVSATSLPVIAAGGIGDGRGVAAVLALGAQAAALGSAFLLADECAIAPAYRAALASERAHHTVLTRAFSGRAARGLPNRFTREFEDHPEDIAPYPFQNAMTRDIRTVAAERGESEYVSLWAGQAMALATAKPAAAIVADLMRDASAALATAAQRFTSS